MLFAASTSLPIASSTCSVSGRDRLAPPPHRPRRASLRTALLALAAVAALSALSGCDGAGAGSDAGGASASGNPVAPGDVVTVGFEIEGMHCTGCVAAIEGTAVQVPGVVACRVSLEDGHAECELRDDAAADAFAERISRMGYVVRRAAAE